MGWYFYIVECSNTSLYCGITNNIEKRLEEHNKGLGGKYTRSRLPVTLKYTEPCSTRSEALKRECQVKSWTRAQKRALVQG